MLEEQVDRISNAVSELKEEQGAKWGIKDMERQRANLEAQILELRNDAKKDDVLDFEQLGIDALFVDEAHVFKNLSILQKFVMWRGLQQMVPSRQWICSRKFSIYRNIQEEETYSWQQGLQSPIQCAKCM